MEELDLRYIMGIINKRKMIIIAITLVALIFVGIYSFLFLKTSYIASSYLLVVNERDTHNITYGDINAPRIIAKTYMPLIQRRLVLEKVADNLNLPDSVAFLRSSISVSSIDSTELISITVRYMHPLQAVNIANEVADVFTEEISAIYFVDNIVNIEYAVSASPVRPRYSLYLMAALLLGIATGVALAFFLEFLEDTIKTPRDVIKYLDLPVLGNIPSAPQRVKSFPCRDPLTGAYRFLVNNIQYLGLDRRIRTILVTPTNTDGRNNTMSVNLATMLSKAGSSVLIVDVVFNNPTLHKIFNVRNDTGFSDIAMDTKILPVEVIKITDNKNLHLITGGSTGANINVAKPLPLNRIKEIFDVFLNEYDYIIFNTPQLITYTDVAVISAYADATIMVFEYGKVSKEEAVAAKEHLLRGRANIIGGVINDLPTNGESLAVKSKIISKGNKALKRDIDRNFPF